MKTPKKNADWKNKFFYLCVSSFVELLIERDLSPLHDKLELYETSPIRLKKLDRDGFVCKLNSKFELVDMVWAGFSQAQLYHEDYEKTGAHGSNITTF